MSTTKEVRTGKPPSDLVDTVISTARSMAATGSRAPRETIASRRHLFPDAQRLARLASGSSASLARGLSRRSQPTDPVEAAA